MSNQDNGGPAFPRLSIYRDLGGMTMRDYFAAKAMKHFIDLHPTQIWNATFDIDGGSTIAKQTAKAAYFMADAMLAAREAK